MRRKAAFFVSIVTAVLLIAMRCFVNANPTFAVGSLAANNLILLISLVAIAAIVALSIAKQQPIIKPSDTVFSSISGWLCTFCGAIIAMSSLLDIFCWVVYKQVPPPAEYIYNRIDLVASVASLLFGVLGGVYLVMQGFAWMSQSTKHQSTRNWLALTPVLWMWFRLARYEISYSSTIDIRESFFDFAVLVFASLFFLQLARMVSGIGAEPKNSLLIFALCTAMVSLSHAPTALNDASSGMPIGYLLIALADLVIGFFALSLAALQVFQKPSNTETKATQNTENDEEDGMAWTEPAVEHEPLEPAFDITKVLPQTETKPTPAQAKPETSSAPPTTEEDISADLTVEDILSEIDTFG